MQLAKQFYNQESFPQSDLKILYKAAISEFKTWTLVFLYFVSFGGFLGLTVWLPSYFTYFYFISNEVAGFVSGVFAVVTALSRVPGSFIAEKRPEISGIISMVVFLVGCLILIFSETYGLSIFGVLFLGMGMGGNNASVHHLVYKYLPSCLLGSAIIISGLGTFGGFVIPSVMGSISGYANGYRLGFVFLAILGIFSLAIHIFNYVKFRHIEKQVQPYIVWL